MSFDIPYTTGGNCGGGSPWSFPTMPIPLKDEGLIMLGGNAIPHKGILVDNINIVSSTLGVYTGFLGETLIWEVSVKDIDEFASGFVGRSISCWYDSVNDRLYVFCYNEDTDPYTFYTAYITLETGTVTNVGNTQLTVNPISVTKVADMAVGRATIDSGNFTLKFSDRTIVLDESTGAEVSNIASLNTTQSRLIGNYTTLDGMINLYRITHGSSGNAYIELTRSQQTVTVNIPDSLFSTLTDDNIHIISWGDKVKVHIGSSSNRHTLSTFLRTEFDTWLHKVCDHGGLA